MHTYACARVCERERERERESECVCPSDPEVISSIILTNEYAIHKCSGLTGWRAWGTAEALVQRCEPKPHDPSV